MSVKDRVFTLLQQEQREWKAREVAEVLHLNRKSIETSLRNLADKGEIVRHEYWSGDLCTLAYERLNPSRAAFAVACQGWGWGYPLGIKPEASGGIQAQ